LVPRAVIGGTVCGAQGPVQHSPADRELRRRRVPRLEGRHRSRPPPELTARSTASKRRRQVSFRSKADPPIGQG